MTTTEELIQRCHQYANSEGQDADSLIGFFQLFRPDGGAIAGLFDFLDVGDRLHDRLDQLYAAAGEGRHPTNGGRDAYFVIRDPPQLDPDEARQLGEDWLSNLAQLAHAVGEHELAETLNSSPTIRVLEGIAPKHPKAAEEKSTLLKLLQSRGAEMVDRIDAGPAADALKPAYYFVACDSMLRDYLMWPLYAAALGDSVSDPFASYFRLWQHGVKYRIFGDTQVDLYLPRQTV